MFYGSSGQTRPGALSAKKTPLSGETYGSRRSVICPRPRPHFVRGHAPRTSFLTGFSTVSETLPVPMLFRTSKISSPMFRDHPPRFARPAGGATKSARSSYRPQASPGKADSAHAPQHAFIGNVQSCCYATGHNPTMPVRTGRSALCPAWSSGRVVQFVRASALPRQDKKTKKNKKKRKKRNEAKRKDKFFSGFFFFS